MGARRSIILTCNKCENIFTVGEDCIIFKEKTSKYVGVYCNAKKTKWRAQIHHRRSNIHIGIFDTEREAGLAVNLKCLEMGLPLKNPHLKLPTMEEKKKVI